MRIWIALLLWACATPPMETVRAVTYPPTFEYLARSKVRSDMHQIADHVAKLDELLRREDRTPSEVIGLLDEIESAAANLAAEGGSSGHATLDHHLPRFQSDVRAAKQAVERSPPDYFFAGAIAGSCIYCHH